MAEITAFKPLSAGDIFKGESKTLSAFKSAYGNSDSAADTSLTWYIVERDTTSWSTAADDMKNLFMSFGLAREDQEDWYHALGTLTDYYNAKRIMIASIPQSECGSYIDGSTLKVNVPIGSGTTEYITLYGSSYQGYPYKNANGITYNAAQQADSSVYGCQACYLFANTAGSNTEQGTQTDGEHPYTGTINGNANLNSTATSWDSFVVNTDDPHIQATHANYGDLGKDVPLGIAFLEKGLFVIFDMYGRDDLINGISSLCTSGAANFIWTANTADFVATNGTTNTVNTDANIRQNIIFTGANANTSASVTFRTITDDYKMIYFCHAGQGEFNSTTNHTYNHSRAYFRPEESDSLYVSEIALYGPEDQNGYNVPLAFAKLSEPVEKSKLDTLTFKVTLSL